MPGTGQVIGSYAIEAAVAHGRSGLVHRAVSPAGRHVALKVHDRADVAAAEITCLQTVDHPRVIKLIASGETPNGQSWIAMPWVEGQTLGHLLDTQGPLALQRVRGIVSALADGLDALHAAGFVHGDLAPSNILVADDDQITIVDLATASRVGDEPASLDTTVAVELETTPRFASPEVAAGKRPGPASDIYALALIAYEALTGTSPFAEVATPIAMLSHHASSVPQALTEHRPDLPGAVEDAIFAALAKAPSERPASAATFAHLIASDGPGRSRKRRARPGLGAATIAGLVSVGALLVVGLFFFVRGDEQSQWQNLGGDMVEAGDAARTVCNLVVGSGFDGSAVFDHYYGGDETNTAMLEPGAGVGSSAALRLGANGAFGIFGEIVPIDADEPVVFSAWMRAQGEPSVTAMYVDYLDAEFQEMTAARADVLGASMASASGERTLLLSQPPPGATYAVPTFFKDGSAGSLFVDEVIFGTQRNCSAELDP